MSTPTGNYEDDNNRPEVAWTVADTILEQLGGGRRLSMMIGAHAFIGNKNALTFRFKARAKNGANCIRVTLDPSDTYTVEFISVRGSSVKEKDRTEDIYNDMLKEVVERHTGLALSF